MKPIDFRNHLSLLKGVSICLIASFLGLELINRGCSIVWGAGIQGFDAIFAIGRVALVAHALEAAVAAVYAPSRQRSRWRYGIYTFFVGAPGLVELFQLPSEQRS